MISQDRLEKAMTYLATTDEEAADLQTEMERSEFRARAVKDALIAHGEGGLGDRTARAGCAQEYLEAMDAHYAAVKAFVAVKNKRHTEEIVIDVYRTLEASRRKA